MVIKRMTTRWLAATLGAILISFGASSVHAAVEASLDRRQVGLGERLQLQIRSQGANMGIEPDLSALGDAFYVLGRSQSVRTTIVNGRRDASVDWLIELTPLRAGNLQIPRIAIGSEYTAPIEVHVTESPTPPQNRPSELDDEVAGAPKRIELKAEVDRTDPYVQEQVALTLRLESGVPIVNGSLSEPEIPGAIVEKLGDDRSEVIEANGQPVYVFERRYALFPQQSGELLIHPSVFDGAVRTEQAQNSRRSRRFGSVFDSPFDDLMGGSMFDDFFGGTGSLIDQVLGGRGQPVRVLSDPLQLVVRERPEQAVGERWLPAQDLELVEIWGDGRSNPPTMEVGEPVDRVVAVRARGVIASQLPIPELAEVDGLKQYTEPAYEDSQEAGRGLVAVRALPTVLIPTRAGSLTLPPVEVEWWDTEADQARTASLPARTVKVLPGADGDLETAAVVASPLSTDDDSDPGAPPAASLNRQVEPGRSTATWVGLGLSGAAGIIGMLWLKRQRTRDGSQPVGVLKRRSLRRTQERALRNACSQGDAQSAEAALLALGCLHWHDSPPRTTGAIADRLEAPEFQQALRSLSAHRFAEGEDAAWNGESLWLAYRQSGLGRGKHGSVASHTGPDVLPDLYPTV